MQSEGTLLLQRSDVAQLLTLTECIDAVERVFRWQGEGKIPAAGILGVKAAGGGLHVKACHLPGNRSYLVAKLNTNFSDNPRHRRLPTIQGVIVLCDAESGYPLAIVDSTDITTKRTAAASAVAAKYLARSDSSVATICGCGKQGYAQLQALLAIFRLKKVYLFDLDEQAIKNFASALRSQKELEVKPVYDLSEALRTSDICVTCTPSRQFFVRKKD